MNLDGFNTQASFSSTNGGVTPAFLLSQGFPQNFEKPPFIDPGFRNGQSTLYRPFDANRRSYSQQWNFTVERQLGADAFVSVGYVGNKGTRLPSKVASLNVLPPSLLSMGDALFDEFKPGDTSLHGVPLPYAGWVEQMTGCAPSVAQALLPFPQFCGELGLHSRITMGPTKSCGKRCGLIPGISKPCTTSASCAPFFRRWSISGFMRLRPDTIGCTSLWPSRTRHRKTI